MGSLISCSPQLPESASQADNEGSTPFARSNVFKGSSLQQQAQVSVSDLTDTQPSTTNVSLRTPNFLLASSRGSSLVSSP